MNQGIGQFANLINTTTMTNPLKNYSSLENNEQLKKNSGPGSQRRRNARREIHRHH
jgi:hypothetical protein